MRIHLFSNLEVKGLFTKTCCCPLIEIFEVVMMSIASPGLRVGEKEDVRSKFPADHEELEFTPTRRKSGPAGLGTYVASCIHARQVGAV